eukprot:CAMPEP_0201536112 /NCGR_PEP_ID=MMETSP0161_2-20130828/60989_1 /ASSEMBLY_ACC=CAM_ASM_000251 /TAXON_ID=180227 /ORGANISM="Neoparamoeba aestuarina, Strain SoJaBio B1-5/56/2" /LENGTH=62 /DNA_ID=CAMNT_0047941625 /DNA_START=600 /DNA_END=788 /DNA_ORIENTATION=-
MSEDGKAEVERAEELEREEGGAEVYEAGEEVTECRETEEEGRGGGVTAPWRTWWGEELRGAG